MTKSRPDPAELAALIEQGMAKGLDVVEAFRAATGKGPKNSSKTLEIEHRKTLDANRRTVKKYKNTLKELESAKSSGAVVAGVGSTVGLLDVLTSGDFFLPTWMWFGGAALGLVTTIRARRRLRTIGPPPVILDPVAPPSALPRSAIGSPEVARFTSARAQIVGLAPQLDRLYPGSGAELRRADLEAAGPLTALCDRLLVLDQMQRELPDTSAAASAAKSAELVRTRLSDGCATYDHLLAAAARLLASPDLSRSTEAILGPAVDAMVAYAHGLQRAADL